MRIKHTKTLLLGLSANERKILGELHKSETLIVTASLLETKFKQSHSRANLSLSRLERKGWLQRYKSGIYGLVDLSSTSPKPIPPEPRTLAIALFSPCYISGWTAAEHWNFTEQIFNSIMVCSTKLQRHNEQLIAGVRYRVRKISADQIFGTTKVWIGSAPLIIADPHRTIIDILLEPELGGGGRLAVEIVGNYFKSKDADLKTLLEYAKRLNKGVVFKRLGFLAEVFSNPTKEWVKECRRATSKGVSLLDPLGSKRGPIRTHWNLQINVPIEGV